MKKKCECISKVIKIIKTKNKITENYKFETEGIGFYMEGLALTFTEFRWKKKEGRGKWDKKVVVHSFCPFCGEKK